MYCRSCGGPNCSCSEEQLAAFDKLSRIGDEIAWWDAQALRLVNASSTGGIKEYEEAEENAAEARQRCRHLSNIRWDLT